MRLPRLLLACLLSFGVSLQGYASVAVMDASCPMQQHAMGGSGSQQHCHTDLATAAQGGAHCHHGIGCQPAGPAAVSVQFLPVFQPLLQPAPPVAEPGFHSHTAPLLWRPPALI